MQYGVYPVISPEQAEMYRLRLEQNEWATGQARTAELTGTIKQNLEQKPGLGPDGEAIKNISGELTKITLQNQPMVGDTLFKKMTMYKFNKFEKNENTPDGGAYHRHTDAPWMGDVRTDFTLVLALSDPKTYEGGDHHVVDPHHGEIVFRPEAGELMIYETRYEHWVDPVTDGSRICALAWMESSVMGKDKRAILKKCREISSALEQEMLKEGTPAEYRKWFVDVGVVHSALMRMWAQR